METGCAKTTPDEAPSQPVPNPSDSVRYEDSDELKEEPRWTAVEPVEAESSKAGRPAPVRPLASDAPGLILRADDLATLDFLARLLDLGEDVVVGN